MPAPSPTGQQLAQVFIGARRISHLELHRCTDADDIADGNGTRLPIDPQYGTDEEVAALELVLALVDHDAAVQALLGESVVGWERCPSVESSRSRAGLPPSS